MKIEIEKPVVPQFVADWIEKEKHETTFHKSMARAINLVLHDEEWKQWEFEIGNRWSRIAATAWLYGYEVEQPLYYAKSKLTGQYLGDRGSFFGDEDTTPAWLFDKGCMDVLELPKVQFKNKYGLDETNADFEEVE